MHNSIIKKKDNIRIAGRVFFTLCVSYQSREGYYFFPELLVYFPPPPSNKESILKGNEKPISN
jgi:hypothetical protein